MLLGERKVAGDRYVLSLHNANWFHKLRFARSIQSTAAFTVRCLRFLPRESRIYKNMNLLQQIISSAATARPKAIMLIHFIWIFHLKVISKIVQVDYRPTRLPTTIQIQIIGIKGEKKIDFSFMSDIGAIRSFGFLAAFS